MKDSLRPVANRCFGVTEIPVPKRVNVCRAVLLSRGIFGASTWHEASLSEKQMVHANVMYAYRTATASHYCEVDVAISDQRLIIKFDLVAPFTFVHLARLGLAIRVASKCRGILNVFFTSRRCSKELVEGW